MVRKKNVSMFECINDKRPKVRIYNVPKTGAYQTILCNNLSLLLLVTF